jgi:hypothetical protein
MTGTVALAVFAAAGGVHADAQRTGPTRLEVTARVTIQAARPTRAVLWADGCAAPTPTWLSCGPKPRLVRVRLRAGRNVIVRRFGVRRWQYAPPPPGAGLAPWRERLVPAPTDVAWVGLRAAGRELVPPVETGRERVAE